VGRRPGLQMQPFTLGYAVCFESSGAGLGPALGRKPNTNGPRTDPKLSGPSAQAILERLFVPLALSIRPEDGPKPVTGTGSLVRRQGAREPGQEYSTRQISVRAFKLDRRVNDELRPESQGNNRKSKARRDETRQGNRTDKTDRTARIDKADRHDKQTEETERHCKYGKQDKTNKHVPCMSMLPDGAWATFSLEHRRGGTCRSNKQVT
jgi:hypothetical protein